MQGWIEGFQESIDFIEQKLFKSSMELRRLRHESLELHFVLLLRYILESRWRVEPCWIIV